MRKMIPTKQATALSNAVEKGNIKADGSLNVSGGTQWYLHTIQTSVGNIYVVDGRSAKYEVGYSFVNPNYIRFVFWSPNRTLTQLKHIVSIDTSYNATLEDGSTTSIYSSGAFIDTVTKL